MKTVHKKTNIFTFLLFVFMVFSCSDAIEFTEYKSLANSEWDSGEVLTFSFEITDTISPKNLFINIRNNQEYNFSNLFVITSLNFPNGTKIVDTLQYEMANEKGEYLGTGLSNIKESKLFYKESKVFPSKGKYEFTINQAMRKQGEVQPLQTLKGIQDVGFSIEKIVN
ncbi:MAG: gliding motility lipoprotein GldH [Flavobacteriaceae bacterium]|nr:gliding motility lipoprotein GldH [Flavobacteriaceae bacterium]